ncbi:MAG: DEAD/DEAH box helicase [Deltaproteobacteria bacterium]|nr:DEAD/DEAH box helicase [Deltaproteobacteria bacterium]
MDGRDITVQSRTGSGKTAAFAIPFAQSIVSPDLNAVQVLVLEPTRELAIQVAAECAEVCAHRNLEVLPIYGGAPIGPQIDRLKKGVQIVAGTPGRVLDHMRRKTLRTGSIEVLVLDEADEMLSMGFLEDIKAIIDRLPARKQTLLFSATVPDDIKRLASRYMVDPEHISLSADYVGVHEISHTYYQVSGMMRVKDLIKVLEIEKVESAIIFCNTRKDTTAVARYLKKAGLDAEAISSDLNQSQRERVMERTRSKKLRFLVATDIAARGIDIDDLSHVINYTFPTSPDVYIHRTGRTGRAGKTGKAVSLVGPQDVGHFYQLKLTHRLDDGNDDRAYRLRRLDEA